jgi:hypothetical protein
VARLGDRLARLEGRARPAAPVPSEEERRERWLWRQRDARRELTPKTVYHVGSMIRWLRMVGKIPANVEALIERILEAPDASGYRQAPEERSPAVTEAEVWRAVHNREPGLEHLAAEMPPEWADAFRAADEWRDKLLSMPLEAVARWVIANRRLMDQEEATGEKIVALAAAHMGPYGIDEPLLERVASPARGVHDAEAGGWMIHAPVADDLCSEWAWRVAERIRQLDESGGN